MKVVTVVMLATLALGCNSREVHIFSNFDYSEYLATTSVEPSLRIPPPEMCIAHIESNSRYVCIFDSDHDFTMLFVDSIDNIRTLSGHVYYRHDNYFVITRDRRSPNSIRSLRISKLFPQGREGIFADCIGFNDDIIMVYLDNEVSYYDWDMNSLSPSDDPDLVCTHFANEPIP